MYALCLSYHKKNVYYIPKAQVTMRLILNKACCHIRHYLLKFAMGEAEPVRVEGLLHQAVVMF